MLKCCRRCIDIYADHCSSNIYRILLQYLDLLDGELAWIQRRMQDFSHGVATFYIQGGVVLALTSKGKPFEDRANPHPTYHAELSYLSDR